ncbi:MAG: glycosyltransferase family 2 protein [Candidatus Omnitrophota bacterium]
MKISVVIPVYQGARTIARLADELMKTFSGRDMELVLVNDGSGDSSHDECVGVFKKHKDAVSYVNLAKNFGEHNAVMAGLNYATGDYAVIIDDDFQNPPEEILKLVECAADGDYDVVYSYYRKKAHSLFRNLGSKFNDMVGTFLLDKPGDLYLSSFKCVNRFVIDEITAYKGPFPYIDGLILRTTRKIGKVMVKHDRRAEGKSGYTLRKLVRLWLNMFTNFSVIPLRISTLFGFAFSILGGIFSVHIVIEKFLHPETPMGVTSILVAILVFAGIQLVMLGFIGEYLGKQYLTANQTPQYVVRGVLASGKERKS